MSHTDPTSTDNCSCAPGCCGASPADPIAEAAQDTLRGQVREGYSRIAATGSWSALQADSAGSGCAGGGCCGPATFTPEELATAIGYTQAELAVAPEGANMGLSWAIRPRSPRCALARQCSTSAQVADSIASLPARRSARPAA